jgi:Zn-finger nucleic acid-binding protein
MADKQGIEIDYCPKCRGIWLDRGELEKIIERSTAEYQTPVYNQNNKEFYDDDDHYDKHDKHHNNGHQYGRKKSWWMELLD